MRVLFLQKYLSQEMLGICYLSAALRRAGHETVVLMVPDPQWERKLVESAPDLVACSMTTGDHGFYGRLAARVQGLVRAPVIFGGPHPTFVPDIVREPGVDYVCRGEGEHTLVELATRLGGGLPVEDVPNLTFLRGEERVDNPLRPLVHSLDDLGSPDREPLYAASELYERSERKVFLTQRGCLYNCSFCFHHAWRHKLYHAKGNQYLRKRSVDQVVGEIDDVRRRHPLSFVHFLDDIFNVDDEWLEEFCKVYPKVVGIPFDVILRTNLTSAEHMRQLRSAGCISARLAFESASDKIRNGIFRKGTTLADLKNSARHVKEQGIRLTTLSLLGSPGASIEDELATLQLNVDCKVDHPLCSLLQPYPETDINDITKDMGYAVDRLDQFPNRFNRRSTIALDDRKTVENLHKLFPIAVRFPVLMPLVRRAIKVHGLSRVYLALYLLWTEYLVCEQNRSFAVAMGTAGFRNLPLFDFLRRVTMKTRIKVSEALFGRRLSGARLRLEMETDTIAHAGG
jgi:anaerobic magnesium-protoporphyrin IX monomethyl ester cyclase